MVMHTLAAFAGVSRLLGTLVAVAPGPMAANPAALPWTKLPAGIARRP